MSLKRCLGFQKYVSGQNVRPLFTVITARKRSVVVLTYSDQRIDPSGLGEIAIGRLVFEIKNLVLPSTVHL